jgi:hypothetical protein
MRQRRSRSELRWAAGHLLTGAELASLFLLAILLFGGPDLGRLLLRPENWPALLMLLACLVGLFTCAALATALTIKEPGVGSGRRVRARWALSRVPAQPRSRRQP